jgi:hypothetical protein
VREKVAASRGRARQSAEMKEPDKARQVSSMGIFSKTFSAETPRSALHHA